MFNPASPPPSLGKMLKTFFKLAIPSIITNLLVLLNGVCMVFFAGQLDNTIYISVVGLTFTVAHIMVFSLTVGIDAAQETLTSQAFGSNNLRLCGIYLNRGIFI